MSHPSESKAHNVRPDKTRQNKARQGRTGQKPPKKRIQIEFAEY